MKINPRFLVALMTFAASLGAAPLTSSTAVHSRPDASAPTIATLSAGTEPTPAVGIALPLSSGWSAIELPGSHEAYIQNKDLQKDLEVRPGAAFRSAPKLDAPVISSKEAGDEVQITGYHGKWTKVNVTKKVVGYIQGWSAGGSSAVANASGAKPAATSMAPAPAPAAPAKPVASAPFSPAPGAPAAVSSGGPGHATQMVNLGDGGSASLPRLFQGKFVSTKSLLRPRRPYDYQLNDSAGERYAYLDISRLLQTEQIDKYVDHTVTVYGTAKPVSSGSKDIVVEVESLQLR